MKRFTSLVEEIDKGKYFWINDQENIICEGLFDWLKRTFSKAFKWLTSSDNNGYDWNHSISTYYNSNDDIYDSDDEDWDKKYNLKNGDKIIGKLIRPVKNITYLSEDIKKIIDDKKGGFPYLSDLLNKKIKLGEEEIDITKISALEFMYQNPADDEDKMVPAGIICLYDSFKPVSDGTKYLTLIDIEESNIIKPNNHDENCSDMYDIFEKIVKKQFPDCEQIVYYIPTDNITNKNLQIRNVNKIQFKRNNQIKTIFIKKL